jgi:hypothetical protein
MQLLYASAVPVNARAQSDCMRHDAYIAGARDLRCAGPGLAYLPGGHGFFDGIGVSIQSIQSIAG